MEEYSVQMKRFIFLMMVAAEFLVACVPSIFAPFLPAEAEKKGRVSHYSEPIMVAVYMGRMWHLQTLVGTCPNHLAFGMVPTSRRFKKSPAYLYITTGSIYCNILVCYILLSLLLVTPSQYGLIFAVDQVTCMLCAPIIGGNLANLGAKFVLCSGLFIVGICCCLFGLLAWCPGPTKFLFLAYAIGLVQGLGTTSYGNSSISIVTDLFRESANAKRSLLTSVFTIAMVISPSIGGMLYYLGGFGLPFLTFGVLIIFGGVVLFFTLPNVECAKKSETSNDKSAFKVLLKCPLTWLAMLSIFSVSVTCATYETTLEPHIRQFQFSPAYASLFFVISPGVSAVVNSFSGAAIDKGFHPRKMMLIASVAIIIAYSIIGPLPFLPFKPTPYSVGGGLGVLGVGIALFFAAGFGELLRVAELLGLELNQETNGVVTSLWQANLSFGFFVGPIISGTLLQYFGFRWEILFPISVNLILLVIVISLAVRAARATNKYSVVLDEKP